MERVGRSRPVARPAAIHEEEVVSVHSRYAKDAHGAEHKRVLRVRKFDSEPAYARVSVGETRNMGDYESLRIDVSVSLPCYPEEITDALAEAADTAVLFLQDELSRYIGERNGN